MDTLSITFTGRLTRDPREITAQNGTGASLWIEVPLDNSRTCYLEATAWGTLAAHVLDSVRQNDRVTVRGSHLTAKHWAKDTGQGKEISTWVAVRASDISVSLVHDTATTGYASRRAAATAAVNGEPSDLPAADQADLKVLAGVTAPAA